MSDANKTRMPVIALLTQSICSLYTPHSALVDYRLTAVVDVIKLPTITVCVALYTQGEIKSQNLWSRYDRHFVGMACGVDGRIFAMLFKRNLIGEWYACVEDRVRRGVTL